MVSRAVALATPDHEGARTGRNPFRLFMDACKYAVGGGLFQLPKEEGQGDSHFTVLGVPTWATKVDIERAYNKTKRQQKQRTTTDEDVKAVEVAFEILSNTESRKAYDLEMGKGSRIKDKLRLVPLGFFSKSLTSAQQNWATWERELLAVLEGVLAFRSVIGSFEVVIHTDHLNNTVLATDLKNPDKILRLLLKIDSLIKPKWGAIMMQIS